jgi:hypothetical protein
MKSKGILLTGLIAGTLDGLAAVIQFKINGGGNPALIAKYIAGALLGREAFKGGTAVVLTGIVLHYCIAIVWTAFFFLIYPKIKFACPNKFAAGVLYGVLIWVVMNLVVLPLTQLPQKPGNLAQDLTGLLIIIFAVGLPISLLHRNYTTLRPARAQ